MKTVFVLLAVTLLSAQGASAADDSCQIRATRLHRADGRFYAIRAAYDRCGIATIPSTWPLSAAHYDARITVYKIVGSRYQHIATFNGIWTERGCFEDSPGALVATALDIKKKQAK